LHFSNSDFDNNICLLIWGNATQNPGRFKVNTQWNLYCMVHNIEKLAKNGYAQ